MHELPVIKSILDICLKHTKSNDVQKIIAIHLEVGEMSDLEDHWMQKYFDFISKGSLAEGAALKIRRIPVRMRCNGCENLFQVDIKAAAEISCPQCHAKQHLSMISGKDYKITNMEVM